MAHFRKVGHRMTGNRQQGRSTGMGCDRVDDAINDAKMLTYVAVLADEQQTTAIGYMSRALAWLIKPGCRVPSGEIGPRNLLHLTQICQGLQGTWPQAHSNKAVDTKHKRQSRKFYPDALQAMAYSIPFQNSAERNLWLPQYLSIYNRLRKH
jgi:hypothetical protein